jgi:hypothetical protein
MNPEARPIRRAVYIRPCCHRGFIVTGHHRCQTTGSTAAGSSARAVSALARWTPSRVILWAAKSPNGVEAAGEVWEERQDVRRRRITDTNRDVSIWLRC